MFSMTYGHIFSAQKSTVDKIVDVKSSPNFLDVVRRPLLSGSYENANDRVANIGIQQ
jgi:hypothetical protein